MCPDRLHPMIGFLQQSTESCFYTKEKKKNQGMSEIPKWFMGTVAPGISGRSSDFD